MRCGARRRGRRACMSPWSSGESEGSAMRGRGGDYCLGRSEMVGSGLTVYIWHFCCVNQVGTAIVVPSGEGHQTKGQRPSRHCLQEHSSHKGRCLTVLMPNHLPCTRRPLGLLTCLINSQYPNVRFCVVICCMIMVWIERVHAGGGEGQGGPPHVLAQPCHAGLHTFASRCVTYSPPNPRTCEAFRLALPSLRISCGQWMVRMPSVRV